MDRYTDRDEAIFTVVLHDLLALLALLFIM